MNAARRPPRQVPAGGTTLAVVAVVALLLLLLAGVVHGRLLTAQRLAANQVHATRAGEAAEAGVAWLLAHLNAGGTVDAACRPAPGSGASFVDRFAGAVDADSRWAPPDARAGCTVVAGGTGWACQCPLPSAGGPPGSPAPDGTPPAPAEAPDVSFAVRLLPARRADLLQLVSDGCSGGTAPCAAGDGDGRAQVAVSVARLPALRHAPAAALTVSGRLDLGATPWALASTTGGAVALHTGGPVAASRLTLTGPPGAPRGALQAVGDTALRDAPPAQRFAAQFQLAPPHWQTLPAVHRIDCHTPCDGALHAVASASGPAPLLWLRGGLHVTGPLTLGTPDRPVLVVADGPVRLGAPAVLHGLLHLRATDWQGPGELRVTGAVTAEGDLVAQGPATVRHVPAVLDVLRRDAGAFLRVPGSWRDFE